MKDDSTGHNTRGFQLFNIQVLRQWHHRLLIEAVLSLIIGLAIAALPWMPDLWSSRRRVLLRTESTRWIISSALLSPMLQCFCDLSKQFFSMYENLFLSIMIFRLCPLHWCCSPMIYFADTTLGTVSFDTPNNVAISATDAPAKRIPNICPLSKSDRSPISRISHTNCHTTQLLIHWHEHYTV
jgi:hypothetical protein